MSKQFLITLGAILLLLVLAFLFVPVMDLHQRQRINQIYAVKSLQRLNTLQQDYAMSNPGGFACELQKLRPAGPSEEYYDRDKFLFTGEGHGYRFTMANCDKGPDGMVRKYQVIAVPIQPGQSGFNSYCIDQAGTVRDEGSTEKCLASGRPL